MAFLHIHNLSKSYALKDNPSVANVSLDINKGEIVSLLGPSGCGKTTTLRMIAGFERPSSGSIRLNDNVIFDSDHSTPIESRGIGMVFQDYALFPHLTIERNVVFGLTKMSRLQRKERAKEMLDLIGLAEYAKMFPHELSGGQQQRVALARALAPNPHLILLDEPFSNLDASLRDQMRQEIATLLKRHGTTAIFVTHDQKDAFAISDRVVVMDHGVIQQIAKPRELYKQPINQFVAQFVGKTNIISATLKTDLKHADTKLGVICLPEKQSTSNWPIQLSIRPEACTINEAGQYHGEIKHVNFAGEYQEVTVSLKSSELEQDVKEFMLIRVAATVDLVVGQPLSFDIETDLVSVIQ
ncbi:ABC transporter ATP-binding protein [Alkalicoccobacillus porphyridii]|uniref:Carnitine transport ATP-binding protein OpuCA n=1 Tax=Alkalicoccobacillus porphyridii TaxID=2597270 RepID=A0A553ZYY5_9BACI|nr:ABC transporter ATP-binding protein [Alkalicoccobacillus porphyridii]TSB46615.1 ABC transporter ATP-binding protein [Alkalicoccobacillus porphyridii]